MSELQDLLKRAGFDVGARDGEFGTKTAQAIWAFRALTGRKLLSSATPEMIAELRNGWRPAPMVPGGAANRTEIDLTGQVLVLYQGNAVRLITHISSGTGEKYCEDAKSRDPDEPPPRNKDGSVKQVCGTAVTPTGRFRYGRREQGWYRSNLGQLYNPVFFNGGIAVHGATSVPKTPASHGCVRIPMHIAEYFPGLVNTGDRVYVVRR